MGGCLCTHNHPRPSSKALVIHQQSQHQQPQRVDAQDDGNLIAFKIASHAQVIQPHVPEHPGRAMMMMMMMHLHEVHMWHILDASTVPADTPPGIMPTARIHDPAPISFVACRYVIKQFNDPQAYVQEKQCLFHLNSAFRKRIHTKHQAQDNASTSMSPHHPQEPRPSLDMSRPWFPQFVDAWSSEDGQTHWLVMTKVGTMSLADWLSSTEMVSRSLCDIHSRCTLFDALVRMLHVTFACGVEYHDLHADNVLVTLPIDQFPSQSQAQYVLWLIDFEHSRVRYKHELPWTEDRLSEHLYKINVYRKVLKVLVSLPWTWTQADVSVLRIHVLDAIHSHVSFSHVAAPDRRRIIQPLLKSLQQLTRTESQ
jgi:hypothetical protein